MNNETKMRMQDSYSRINNFNEVELGYSKEEAIMESSRCLNCKVPRCVGACPVGINIPAFIECIKNDDVDEAYKIILEQNSLPRICGRVCPQERQCEGACIKGKIGDPIKIGSLERYASDNGKINTLKVNDDNGKKIAIVGSGPSGLSCAGVLIKKGYTVDIYESLHESGGVLRYGIPEFRLPKVIVEDEINRLKKMGVNIINNVIIGKTIYLSDLENNYNAIYIATGAGLPKFMGIKGEDLNGVYSANEILTRINLMKSYKDDSNTPIIRDKKVYVIGGGNVAVDAARCLKRLGNDVSIIYRRTLSKMPARKNEIEHLLEENIEILELTNPLKINSNDNGFVKSVTTVKMDFDIENNLIEVPDTYSDLKCDAVVFAIGTDINNIALNEKNVNVDNNGLIIVNELMQTNNNKIYAGGDATSGSATVIKACEAGMKAANSIDIALSN